MPDIERLVRELSREKMTPEFLAQVDTDIRRGISRTILAAEAVDAIRAGLTDRENQLADLFEDELTRNGEGCDIPGAKQAFEKRSTLLEEALQKPQEEEVL